MLDAEEIAAFIPSTNDNVDDPPRISRASQGRTEEARITLAFEPRTHGIGAGFFRISSLIPFVSSILIRASSIQHAPRC